MSSLLFLCSAAFLASCGAQLPTDVGSGPAVQAATLPTSAREGCAQVEVTLSGRDRVTTRFPAPEAYTGGLVLVPAGEARYDRPGGGTLELPMAVSNGTGADVALPARILLLPDSAVVLFPSGLQGQPHKRPAARGADGTVPEGEPWAGAWREASA